jgi:ubiquinone/menaquinone biosynthesis C-methylase UbiE
MSKQEFDRFASEYETLLERHTRIGGEETGYFASYKVQTVRDVVARRGETGKIRILDFGCGVGQSTPFFRQLFPQAELLGADVSSDSITIAQKRNGAMARYRVFGEDEPLPYEDNSIDIAFTACVLHHIPHADHPRVLQELRRVLKPGGLLFVFEHNPLNPLTVKIVKECPFDENAVLIRAGLMKERMVAAGFETVRLRYCLFIPGWLHWLRPIESALTWCPAGAQYYAMGRK